ncbi:MAG: hypothetical protein AB7U82_02830 [Blastocatellales bacterium]
MRAKTKLKLGQDGVKSLPSRYGGQLLRVSHRYGEVRGLRHKTIKLIDGTISWSRQTTEIPGVTIIGLKTGLQEVGLQMAVSRRTESGTKNFSFWVRYDKVLALGILYRGRRLCWDR